MATDFAVLLHRFLTSHLAGLRGCSPNTIASYRDTFKLLIAWFVDRLSGWRPRGGHSSLRLLM